MKMLEMYSQSRHDRRIMYDECEVVSCAKSRYTRWQISVQIEDGTSFRVNQGQKFPKKCGIYRSESLRKKGGQGKGKHRYSQ